MNYAINPIRWHVKKWARRAVISISGGLGDLWHGAKPPAIRVLTYHRFTDNKYDPVSVRPDDFEAHLQWLSRNVTLLDAEKFCHALEGKQPLERNAVLVTVDDGHRSFYEHAYPLLKKYKVPAILFVCPALVDKQNSAREFMSWDELARVQQDMIVVASHGLSHRSLGRTSMRQAVYEVEEASRQLKLHLGVENPFFAFPFGTRRDFSDELADVLLANGYQYCFTSVHGRCSQMTRSNLFPRVKIESGESLGLFRAIALGRLDAWRAIDNVGWRLQQRGRL